ncbi:hypothetical protein J7J37_01335 [bacterium]|nr:hypothetical protein [bacterium]
MIDPDYNPKVAKEELEEDIENLKKASRMLLDGFRIAREKIKYITEKDGNDIVGIQAEKILSQIDFLKENLSKIEKQMISLVGKEEFWESPEQIITRGGFPYLV